MEKNFYQENISLFWKRFLAYTIDNIIITFFVFLISFIFFAFLPQGLVSFFILCFIMFYYIFSVGKYGKTLGKKMLNLKVVNLENPEEKIGYKKALYRLFAQVLSSIIIFIGHIMILFNKDSLALHDKLSNTRVVENK